MMATLLVNICTIYYLMVYSSFSVFAWLILFYNKFTQPLGLLKCCYSKCKVNIIKILFSQICIGIKPRSWTCNKILHWFCFSFLNNTSLLLKILTSLLFFPIFWIVIFNVDVMQLACRRPCSFVNLHIRVYMYTIYQSYWIAKVSRYFLNTQIYVLKILSQSICI